MVDIRHGSVIELEASHETMRLFFDRQVHQQPDSFDIDADLYAFICGADGMVLNNDSFIFYNNPGKAGSCVWLLGDCMGCLSNRVLDSIYFDLSAIPDNAERVFFFASISDDSDTGDESFGQLISPCYILEKCRDAWDSDGYDTVRCKIDQSLLHRKTLALGELCRFQSGWLFKFVVSPYPGDMLSLCERYGVTAYSQQDTTFVTFDQL